MNFDKLTHFAKIYESKSLSRASEGLKLSKTAVSLSLKSLETDLNLQLFTRSNKQMLPTQEGDFLYQKVSPLLMQIAEIRREALSQSKEFTGVIRIGAPICFGSEKVAPFIHRFRKKHPKARFSLSLDDGETVQKKLSAGEIDFAIVGDDVGLKLPPSVHVEKIFEYELILCCSKKFYHQHLKGHRLTHSHLDGLPFVSLMHISTADWFKVHFNKTAKTRDSYIINNHHVQIQQLLNSQGIGLQSKYSVKRYLESGKLVELKPTERKLNYAFYAVQLFNQVPSWVLKEFITDFKAFLLLI